MSYPSRRPGGATAARRPFGSKPGYRSGGSRFTSSSNQGSTGGYSTGRSGRGNKGRKKAHIDPRRFIKAAVLVQDEEVYTPLHTFSDFPLNPQLKANITNAHYTIPTPIQDQSISHALAGRDVIGIANTGTGKTAAFLLPLINRVLNNRSQETVLIMAPTRELAMQIDEELMKFAKNLHITSVLLIGGAPMHAQIQRLRRDPHFIIGTPGRIKDLATQKQLHLSRVKAIVLDEVDRMLDMGFIKDIRHILEQVPTQRQSLFFSATLAPSVKDLMHTFLHDPITIAVKTTETSDNVEQNIIEVPHGTPKIDLLHDLLIKDGFDKVLIFNETKYGAERLSKNLNARGFKTTAIHGNKTQGQRFKAIDAFKRGDVNVLVATDVAARGIDVKEISHVINYDTPNSYEDYVHRIGRTGRAGKKGFALTFVD